MKLFSFLSNLLPTFTKSRFKDILDSAKRELHDAVIPMYKSIIAHGGDKRKWKSEAVKTFQQRYDAVVQPKKKNNFLLSIYETLQTMEKNVPVLEAMIEKHYAEDIVRDAMTYLGANLLRYLEIYGFAVKYASKLANWTLTSDAAAHDAQAVGDTGLTPAETEWLMVNRDSFLQAMIVLSDNNFDKKIAEVPDVTITEMSNSIVAGTVGQHRMDPLQMNLIAPKVNPIFYIRMAIANWQYSRYKALLEERQVVEARIIQLKSLEDGKRPANLEQVINYHTGRLKTLEARIAEEEDHYA